MKRKTIGWIVIEYCEDFEQPLGLFIGKALPPGGVLVWTNGPRAVFSSSGQARAAITRTEHYRLAFEDKAIDGIGRLPMRTLCKVVRLEAIESGGDDGAE